MITADRTAILAHVMVSVMLDSGRIVAMSPLHPTADGHRFGDLEAGMRLGDARVVAVQRVPYAGAFTYDILPDSDSGMYVAEGALVGSTLARREPRVAVTSASQTDPPLLRR